MPSLRPRWPSPRRRPPTTEVVGPVPAGPGSDGSHDGTGTPGANRPPRPDPDPVTGIVLIDALLDKAVTVPSSVVHGHVARLRERNPHASPTQVVRMLERQYLLAVSTSGGATGAVAAAPGIGTGTGLALTGSEIATFFATSSAFALAVADVHGIAVEDTARRRALLLATVLGEHGAATVGAEAGLPSTAWARTLLTSMPTSTLKRVNTALSRRLLRRQASRQGALAVGRLAPFGIGAVIGASGARALGRTVVLGAERAFGPPPAAFPQVDGRARIAGPTWPTGPTRIVVHPAPPSPEGWVPPWA